MKYKLTVHTIYELGQRTNQEDCIYPAKGKESDADRLFILCDGMGGHESGEVASATVCDAMSRSILDMAPEVEGNFSDEDLQAAIAQAFDALDALETPASSQKKKMGTTMTCLKLHDEGCTIAHIGDSRVYHIRPGKSKEDTQILFVTEDHSLVNDLIKVGELTPEEARHAKQKNVITRAMQPNMERRPKADIYHTADIQAGDYFYLCSDGMLEQEEYDNRYIRHNFSEVTGDEEEKVRILTMATSQNSDNHSAIIVHITEVINPLPVEEPKTVESIKKPTPITLVIDEDRKDDQDRTAIQKPTIPPYKPKKSWLSISLFRKSKYLLGCLILGLFALLLAFCSFIVFKLIPSIRNRRTEPVENTQMPGKIPDKKPHCGNSSQHVAPQKVDGIPDKDSTSDDASSQPAQTVQPSQSAQSAQADSTKPQGKTLPSKLRGAMSSHENTENQRDTAQSGKKQ